MRVLIIDYISGLPRGNVNIALRGSDMQIPRWTRSYSYSDHVSILIKNLNLDKP